MLPHRTIQPADVKILGDLDYGQTSHPVACASTPQYRAFVFSGYGGDRVEVTVKGLGRTASVTLADSSLTEIARGTTSLTLALPNYGPDIEVWYILFHDDQYKPARFSVQVKKVGKVFNAPLISGSQRAGGL